MNEVSCRAHQTFFHALEMRGIPEERLVQGLPVTLDDLHDARGRVDWDLHVQLLERLEDLCGGPAALEEIGAAVYDAPPLRAVRALSFFFGNPRQLYWMGCRWVGPSFFAHIRYTFRELDKERVELRLEIPDSYCGSRPFFAICAGSLRSAPRLLGLRDDSEVEAEITPHRGVFVVRPPRRVSLLSLLKRATRLPFAAWTAIEELASQQDGLNRALRDLRESGRRLQHERDRMDTVEEMGRHLLQQLESERLPEKLLGFLADRFGWRGASLHMTGGADDRLAFYGRVGDVDGEIDVAHELQVGDSSVGRLDVWSGPRVTSEADRLLLEKLLPWIAITMLNTRVAASSHFPSAGEAFRWVSKSGDGLFMILDEALRILYAGPGSDDLLGYDSEDFMQLDIAELVHPDDWPRVSDVFQSLSKHSSSAMYSSARLHHRDGSWRQIEGVAVKVMSEGGSDVYLISIGQMGERPSQH